MPLALPELPLFPSAPAASGEPSVPSEKPVWLVGSSSYEYATSLCISSNLHQIKCMSSRKTRPSSTTGMTCCLHGCPTLLTCKQQLLSELLHLPFAVSLICTDQLFVLQHRRSNAGTFRIQILQAQACSAWARESAADDLERLSSCSSARASDDPPPVSEYLGANSEP